MYQNDITGDLTPTNAYEKEELEGYNKVLCSECGARFNEDELTEYHGGRMCEDCKHDWDKAELESSGVYVPDLGKRMTDEERVLHLCYLFADFSKCPDLKIQLGDLLTKHNL